MAEINGISVKSVKTFLGREGYAAQGNLYIGGKKVAFWSQDADGCIIDTLYMEKGYSEEKLRMKVRELNKEKDRQGTRPDGSSYTLEYDLESLMYDLLNIIDYEKEYKRAVKNGAKGLFVLSNGYDTQYWRINSDKNGIKDAILKHKAITDAETKMKASGHDISKLFIFGMEDTTIGDAITLRDIAC